MTQIFLAARIDLPYFVNRRKFNRRNVAGIEEYKNYEYAEGNSILNKLLKIIAYLCFLIAFANWAKKMVLDNTLKYKLKIK